MEGERGGRGSEYEFCVLEKEMKNTRDIYAQGRRLHVSRSEQVGKVVKGCMIMKDGERQKKGGVAGVSWMGASKVERSFDGELKGCGCQFDNGSIDVQVKKN